MNQTTLNGIGLTGIFDGVDRKKLVTRRDELKAALAIIEAQLSTDGTREVEYKASLRFLTYNDRTKDQIIAFLKQNLPETFTTPEVLKLAAKRGWGARGTRLMLAQMVKSKDLTMVSEWSGRTPAVYKFTSE